MKISIGKKLKKTSAYFYEEHEWEIDCEHYDYHNGTYIFYNVNGTGEEWIFSPQDEDRPKGFSFYHKFKVE